MAFVDFKEFFISLGCFSIHQVKVWNEKFDRNNLRRWEKQGKLIRLRQGFYTFSTVTEHGDAPFYFANKIYAPSYISLESALSFHGIIPEGVIQITSVTARKTKIFQNNLGSYIYRSIKPDLMFGYTIQQSTLSHRWSIMMASPEKALLDYLYLNPHYDSKQDMLELRFDSDFMHAELNIEVLDEYLEKFQSKILEVRVRRLKEVYL
ncbi:MAG: hypothetical protein GXY60_08705 [Spirochaetales bacterium]|nr:hypothetical protein [Spirochaetales bacterium]